MIIDQLHVQIDSNECIRENLIQNGFFYILMYNAETKSHNVGFDRMPLIYCMSPDIRNINNFWGVNFHYFNKMQQKYILERFNKNYNIFEHDNKRVILNNNELYNVYSNISIGVRCYNRKGVLDAYRIKNRYIPKYLELSADFFIKTDTTVNTEFELYSKNKGF